MEQKYTNEKNTQILIALLKQKGIKKVIASPGTTNMAFVGSIQNDPFFEMYSVVDERSAAYMACGLAAASGEPVVLSCTGATASRNYMPGLTEAYYRKLPVLAITSSEVVDKVGHHVPQVLDRSVMPNDVVKHSVNLQLVKDGDDRWSCELKATNAILELTRRGGGPVHINLNTGNTPSYETKTLPNVRNIKRISNLDNFPVLPKGKIAIFMGSHFNMNKKQVVELENFCQSNNAVVFCDHTSGYKGKYAINISLISAQRKASFQKIVPDLLIHIGEITGNYYIKNILGKEVWRVSEDGELRDTFRKITFVFEMSEKDFFEHYIEKKKSNDSYLKECEKVLKNLSKKIPELPFSNIWVAKEMHDKIPINSVIHFGILNSLRAWNFFKLHPSIDSNCNVGGFGIDGCLSSLIGASFANKDKLHFGVFGDLSFFYDLNSLGNRQIGNNLRIILINNGKGTEFRNFSHIAAQFGDSADDYISAKGHFGKKSKTLVKNYCESLGFKYLSANNKEEFKAVYKNFVNSEKLNKPLLFEVFTNSEDESLALEKITSIAKDVKGSAINIAKEFLGKKNLHKIKGMIRK